MFWSAVSAFLVLSGGFNDQVGRLSERENQMWQRIEPSIVTLMSNGQATGPAALIDSSGLFVACAGAVLGDDVVGRTFDGHKVHLHIQSLDTVSQLVLLQASDWASTAGPLTAPGKSEEAGGTILAVLSNGPIRAEFVSENRYGVLKPSRRLVPLNEFRFEAPSEEVGTALVVSETGELLGALHATLAQAPTTQGQQALPGDGLAGTGNVLNPVLPNVIRQKFGPSEMTVAYSVGATIIRRVLDGFESESHRVTYPTLGVICSDAVGGGALIQQVVKGSAADKGGIHVGDVMLDIGGRQVRTQIDFARIMLDLEIGKKATIRVKRDAATLLVDVVIAKSS